MTVILVRFVEYGAAAVLFGAPLFLLYSGLALAWTRPLLKLAALVLAAAAPLHFLAQTVEVAGSASALTDAGMLKAAFLELDFGKASLVRGVAGLLALAALFAAPGRRENRIVAVLGAIACASFSWMGHGAATEGAAGWIHLSADILHTLAASAWIGALAVFVSWLARKDEAPAILLGALRRFSGFGILFVCVIVVTGIVNSFFLIGLGHLTDFWRSLYGQVLLAKILLFAAMLWLAARNRATHVPHLERASDPVSAIVRLRNSVLLETVLGVLVLALVAWLGMLPPPSA